MYAFHRLVHVLMMVNAALIVYNQLEDLLATCIICHIFNCRKVHVTLKNPFTMKICNIQLKQLKQKSANINPQHAR